MSTKLHLALGVLAFGLAAPAVGSQLDDAPAIVDDVPVKKVKKETDKKQSTVTVWVMEAKAAG
ncbi:MAG: hypothetical protein O2816_02700 [Planctomycetota bacterium]|nr:hypothetical protein [Planctomycetota bacterium]